MRNYSIAGKRGQWPAPEDTSLSYLILRDPGDALFSTIRNKGRNSGKVWRKRDGVGKAVWGWKG